MKKIFEIFVLIISISFLYGFSGHDTFVLKGTSDIKEGVAVLTTNSKSDTVPVKGGKFEFTGKVTKQTGALILVSGGTGVPVPIVLEPGTILVAIRRGIYRLGGTKENLRLQKSQEQLLPYRLKVLELRQASYQLKGPEQKKVLAAIDSINEDKFKLVASLINHGTGYADLILLANYYRNLNGGYIGKFLSKFKAFSADSVYKEVADYYMKMPRADVGLNAPEFKLPDPQGRMVALSSFRGKYVLVDFWFNNCVFCRRMSPHLKKIYADLKKNDFEIVSISIDRKEDEQDWRRAMKEDAPTWTQLWDPDQTQPYRYGIEGYPTMFLLNRQGVIVEKIVGGKEEDELRMLLGKYVN